MHRLARLGDLAAQGSRDDVRHPRVALEPGDLGRIARAGAHLVGDLLDGGLVDVELTERGKDCADVREERRARPDDQHFGLLELIGVGVEEIRRAVQTDRRLFLCLALLARRCRH